MSYVITFLEGIMAFISPCLLPMIPIYLSFLGVSGTKDKTVFKNAVGFVLGFSIMFIIMGAFSGSIGYFLREYERAIQIISGIIIILFGLVFMDIIHLPFMKGVSLQKKSKIGFANAFLFGIIFSIGWTPCVGAFLGSALMLAANSGSVWSGIGLLGAYAAGIAVPFLLSAALFQQLESTFNWIKAHYNMITKISGGILIITGILMFMGWFEVLFTIFN